MRASTCVTAALVVVLALANVCTAQSGIGPCNRLRAVAQNGQSRIVNFDALWAASKQTPFVATDPMGPWTYEFGICTDVPCGSGRMAAACQETNQPAYYSLGSYPSTITATLELDKPQGTVVLTIPPTGDPPRGSIIHVTCDPKVTGAPTDISVVSAPVGGQPPFIYNLYLTHASACGEIPPEQGACHNLQAHGPNGQTRTVNLDALSTLSALTPFSALDSNTGLQYLFGVCLNINCTANLIPSAACVTTPAPFAFSLGPYPKQITANLTTDGFMNGAIQISLPQYQMQHFTLTLICDYNAIYPSNPIVISPSNNSPPPWNYQILMSHRSACGVGNY